VHITGVPMGHAWLIQGDMIWDPVEAKTYPADQYRSERDAKVFATYSRQEMCHEVCRDDSWGPWIELPGIMHGGKWPPVDGSTAAHPVKGTP
jgi:hypothetical protein